MNEADTDLPKQAMAASPHPLAWSLSQAMVGRANLTGSSSSRKLKAALNQEEVIMLDDNKMYQSFKGSIREK